MKRVTLGLGALLEMCLRDNKGRLSFKGPVDTAVDATGQRRENLARTFDAEEIAVGWLSPYTSAELDEFDEALREERPTVLSIKLPLACTARPPATPPSASSQTPWNPDIADQARRIITLAENLWTKLA